MAASTLARWLCSNRSIWLLTLIMCSSEPSIGAQKKALKPPVEVEPPICRIPDLQNALKILDVACQEGKCDLPQLRAIESNRRNLIAILGNPKIGLIHIFFPIGKSGVGDSYNWKNVSTQLIEKYHAKYYTAYIIGRASDVGVHFDNLKISKDRAVHVLEEMKQQLALNGPQNLVLKPAWLGKDIFQLTLEEADILNIPQTDYQNSNHQVDIKILNQSVEILFMPCREQHVTGIERPPVEMPSQPKALPPTPIKSPVQPRPSSAQRLKQPKVELQVSPSSQKETNSESPRDAAPPEHRIVLQEKATPTVKIKDVNYLDENLGEIELIMNIGKTKTGQVYALSIDRFERLKGAATNLGVGADIISLSVNENGQHYVDVTFKFRIAGPNVTKTNSLSLGAELSIKGTADGNETGGKATIGFVHSSSSNTQAGALFVRKYRILSTENGMAWSEILDERRDISEEQQLRIDDDDVHSDSETTWFQADWIITTSPGQPLNPHQVPVRQ